MPNTPSFSTAIMLFGLLGWIFAELQSFTISPEKIKYLKKAVVNFEVSNAKYFSVGKAGTYFGTGFIVDKKRGLVVTNRHIVDAHPSQIKMTTYDGSSTTCKLLYYDITHDFSILQYASQKTDLDVEQVTLGSYFNAKLGEKVLLIGNNEGEEYSIKQGEIVALIKNKGARYSLTFQTSFDRTGGSSGAPVWNQELQVIGIHFKGTNTSSFELPIDYLLPKLQAITQQQPIERGEIGTVLNLVKIEDAKKYLKFPPQLAEQSKQKKKDIKFLTFVKATIHPFAAGQHLKPGDIIFRLNGNWIGDNLLAFDQLIDQQVGKQIELEVYRRGKKKTVHLTVINGEATKLTRFVLFGGGTFHELNPNVRQYWDINLNGIYLSQADVGSTFSQIGFSSKTVKDRKGVVLLEINGNPIKSLPEFESLVRQLKDGEAITITFKDYYYSATPELKMLTLNINLHPLQVFEFDNQQHKWQPLAH